MSDENDLRTLITPEMIAAGAEAMKELAGKSPSVIASMMFMAILHSAPWRPNYDEAEDATRQEAMDDIRQRFRQH
jgi:hypothetical protein